jgi:uncharacterized protein YkwD
MTTQDNMLSMDSLERKLKGLPDRTIDPALAATAQSLAEMFAAGARFSHNVGGGMSARASANGWSGTMLAENIAYGSETVEGVFRQWMTSSGHRANILDTGTPLAGFGHAVSDERTHYWAANYGAKQAGGPVGEDEQPAPRRRWWQIIFRWLGM